MYKRQGYYRIGEKATFTLGTKIPLSNSDRSLDGVPLPMDYQSSLGTFDLIIGLGYDINKLRLVAALQQPITQNNNQFLSSLYPDTSPLSNFQSTNQFIRKGDFIFRASYPVSLGKNLRLTPSLLPIVHLGKDKFTDEFGVEQEIEGSQGLTLNANIYLDYEINSKNILQLSTGFPFIVRESRPDGLTRSFVLALEYNLSLIHI